MKRLAALLVVLSLGAFAIGCGEGEQPAGNGAAPGTGATNGTNDGTTPEGGRTAPNFEEP